MNESGKQAIGNGYRVSPSPSTKHGFKVWPADWKRTVANNTADVEAWRKKLAR